MLEVEFTSDLLGLLMVGVQARTKATIDKLYRDNDSYVPDIDRLTDLFVGTCDLLDQVFGREQSPSSLKRFRSTGWIYSLRVSQRSGLPQTRRITERAECNATSHNEPSNTR